MSRLLPLLLVMICSAVLTGCGGASKPEPLTPEQEQELQKQMEQVEQQERSKLSP